MIALVGDFHGNRPATEAVQAYIRGLSGINEIWSFGDHVGYGPDPEFCLQWALTHCTRVLRGNHDDAIIDDVMLARFSHSAKGPLNWTRDKLTGCGRLTNGLTPAEYIATLDPMIEIGDACFAHASPADPLLSYLMPLNHPKRMGYWPEDWAAVEDAFARVQRIGFVGHSHIGGVFLQYPNMDLDFIAAKDVPADYEVPAGCKAIVNIGSVGQPRDEDPRACLVVTDPGFTRVSFHRVSYQVDLIHQAMKLIPELEQNADRLLDGR